MPKNKQPTDNSLFLYPDPDRWAVHLQQIVLPFFLAMRTAINSQPPMPEEQFHRLIQYSFTFLHHKIDHYVERLKSVAGKSPLSNDENNRKNLSKGYDKYNEADEKAVESFRELLGQISENMFSHDDHSVGTRRRNMQELAHYMAALRDYIDAADDYIAIIEKISGTQKEHLQGISHASGEIFDKKLSDFYARPLTGSTGQFYEKNILRHEITSGLGWKMHISFAYEDLNKAYEICLPILNEHIKKFKVASPIWLAQEFTREDLRHGGQVTIYMEDNGKAFQNLEKLKMVIKNLTKVLQENNIKPGHYSPDLTLKDTPYFSIRNDIDPSGEYILANNCMGCYNPSGTMFPQSLVELLPDGKKAQYTVDEHFNLFIPKNADELWAALVHTLNAFLKGNHTGSNKDLFSHRHTNTAASARDLKIASEIVSLRGRYNNPNPHYQFQFCVDEASGLHKLLTQYDEKMKEFCGPDEYSQMKKYEYKPENKNKMWEY